jgi:hypothetical protein
MRIRVGEFLQNSFGGRRVMHDRQGSTGQPKEHALAEPLGGALLAVNAVKTYQCNETVGDLLA